MKETTTEINNLINQLQEISKKKDFRTTKNVAAISKRSFRPDKSMMKVKSMKPLRTTYSIFKKNDL